MKNHVSIPSRGKRVVSSPKRQVQLWSSPSLFDEYKGLCIVGYNSRGVKLTTHFHPVPKLRMGEAINSSTFSLQGAQRDISSFTIGFSGYLVLVRVYILLVCYIASNRTY
jgi:hypothetical protein